MSPRLRKASDEEVFAALHRVMQRLGPGELTLAEVAEEVGLTAGALVQRFGGKREMLLAFAAAAAAGTGDHLGALRRQHDSPLATLRAFADGMARLAASPAAVARNLAYLQIDVADPDFRRHLLAQYRSMRDGIEALLREAEAVGELAPQVSIEDLAIAVEAATSGALLTWAIYREGESGPWLRQVLDAVLAGHLAAPRTRARRPAR